MWVTDTGMGKRMGTETKIVTHAGMGMGIFSNCGYDEGDYSTLPIFYSLSSLDL
jgi:hypothetical protein